jgi:predicted NBD/HSP70 family sugar kinase
LTVSSGLPAGAQRVLRRLNERSLFAVLLAEGRLTRVALQHRTGLSLPTITRALANLQDAGLVAEAGTVSTGRGPAAAVYEVRPRDGGVAAAIALTGDMISVSLMSTAGESLACEQERPRRSASGPALVQTVRRLLRTALRSARIDRIHVSHTVVAVPAVVDTDGQLTTAIPSGLPSLEQHHIDAIRGLVGRSSAVDNDVNLAAIGEHHAGAARGIDDIVYLSLGSGIGTGVILGGQLHRGSHGAAGEVGHMPVGPIDPHSRPARRHGAAQLAASEDAVRRLARAAGMTRRNSLAAVLASADRGESAGCDVFATLAKQVALMVASVVSVLDPELVVVGGSVGAAGETLLTPLRRELDQIFPTPPPVVASELGTDAVRRGAEIAAVAGVQEQLFTVITPPPAPSPVVVGTRHHREATIVR